GANRKCQQAHESNQDPATYHLKSPALHAVPIGLLVRHVALPRRPHSRKPSLAGARHIRPRDSHVFAATGSVARRTRRLIALRTRPRGARARATRARGGWTALRTGFWCRRASNHWSRARPCCCTRGARLCLRLFVTSVEVGLTRGRVALTGA